MEKTHRITVRFSRDGQKIDELTNSDIRKSIPVNRDTKERNLEHISLVNQPAAPANDQAAASIELEELEQLIRASGDAESRGAVQRGSYVLPELPDLMEETHLEGSVVASDPLEELEAWLQDTENKCKQLDQMNQLKPLTAMEHTAQSEENKDINTLDYVMRTEAQAVQQDLTHRADSIDAQHNQRGSLTWMQGALSVISAIISGCLIGYLLLTLIFGNNVWPISSLFDSKQQISAEGTAGSKGILASEDQKADSTGNTIQEGTALALHEQTYQYYVLQAGVFTKENTRDEVITSLQQLGYAAEYMLDSNDRYVVYAGLATSASDAEYVQGKIKGIETYRKPLTISLPGAMPFGGEAAQLEKYFVESNALIAMYAELVAAQLEHTSYSPIGKAAQAAWQSNYQSWLALSEQTSALWGNVEQEQLAAELQASLQEADEQLLNYQEEPKSKYLWNVQRALVKSVLLQKDWFEQVNTL